MSAFDGPATVRKTTTNLTPDQQRINHFVNKVDYDLSCNDRNAHGRLSYLEYGINAYDLEEYAKLLRDENWRRKIKITRLPGILYRIFPLASFTLHF
jgi:hypothetical protein